MSEGGFLQDRLSTSSSPHTSTSTSTATLPHPRDHPLKAGGNKESALIRVIDQSLLKIQRRYAKREEELREMEIDPDAIGYTGFSEAAQDIEKLVDLIWISGTPSLQIPYLLNIATLVQQYLTGFAPSPKATFGLLGKLDLAFASLLQGRHIETGEPLPGFEKGRGMTQTETVRLKSVVDHTRVCVVEVIGNSEMGEDEDGLDIENEMDTDNEEFDVTHEVGIGKVYDKTISELGDALVGSPIGIITDY